MTKPVYNTISESINQFFANRRLIVALLAPVCLLGLAWATFEINYWHKIYPGVTVGPIRVGGDSLAQAQAKIEKRLASGQTLTLIWGTSRWTITPAEIGLTYDVEATIRQAYQWGRHSQSLNGLRERISGSKDGVRIAPIFSLQESLLEAKIATIAAQIDVPASEPRVFVDGATQVQVSTGENGQAVDQRRLRQDTMQALTGLAPAEIEVPVVTLQPRLTPDQAEKLRQRAQTLIGKNLSLTSAGQTWTIDLEQMLSWIEPAGWKRVEVERWAAELAQTLDRPPQNATSRYVNGRVEEFRPAHAGVAVKQGELVSLVLTRLDQLLAAGESTTIDIPLWESQPLVKNGDVNILGIRELIGQGESTFKGSIPNRVFNIKKAAANLNGILVAPGETFSFNQYVGDISAAGGYRQAYIIKDGRTILGDGGGVCQVSTTLFRAILKAGLPIEERTAHAYRVHFYEEGSQPGFDATIFSPSVDLKFRNDTPAYILVQTKVDEAAAKLTFELYGTSDGRQVSLSKARVWDVTPPPPDLYQDDPTLPTGTIKQVDWKAWGAKVAFDWKVTRGSDVLQERTFYSNYRPWQAVYLRGTANR